MLNQRVIDRRLCFRSQAPEETREAGERLSRRWLEAFGPEAGGVGSGVRAGLVVSLCGDLGAGKTVFVKGLARGMGIAEERVSSPTFVLANQYASPENASVLNHVDFYRLDSAGELESMGFFDLMAPGALLVVEWGSKFPEELPRDRLEVSIDPDPDCGPEARIFRARGTGADSWALVDKWGQGLEAESWPVALESGPEASTVPEPRVDRG